MDLQKMFDAMSESNRLTRGNYQMTPGKAIEELSKFESYLPIVFDVGGSPGDVDSYRGYYSDLSIEPGANESTVKDLLLKLRGAIGFTFEGYKGGEYTMQDNTPLWTAPYGTTGPAVMGFVGQDGRVVIITREID